MSLRDYRELNAREHLEALHPAGSSGVVCYASKQAGAWFQSHGSPEWARQQAAEKEGCKEQHVSFQRYIGIRNSDALAELSALYVDLDFYRTTAACNKTQQEIAEAVLAHLDENFLPRPSLVYFTHQGLHLTWLIKPIPAHKLDQWIKVQTGLQAMLAGFGASTKNQGECAMMRVAGSNRHDTYKKTYLYGNDERYNFALIETAVSGPRIIPRPAERRGAPPATGMKNKTTLWRTNLTDIEKVLACRRMSEIPQSMVEDFVLLIVVACSWIYAPEHIVKEAQKICVKFSLPCSNLNERFSSVIKRAEQAADGEQKTFKGTIRTTRYHYTAQKMIAMLKITKEEMIRANLRNLATKDLKEQRKKQQRKERRATRANGRHNMTSSERIILGKEVDRYRNAEGLTWKQIAQLNGKSVRTLQRSQVAYLEHQAHYPNGTRIDNLENVFVILRFEFAKLY